MFKRGAIVAANTLILSDHSTHIAWHRSAARLPVAEGEAVTSAPFRNVKKVLIVDDSRTLRAWLRTVLESDPNLEVVGEAADAFEASRLVKTLRPDVLTLDVEMPHLDGLQFLEFLMERKPMPVVMFSSTTDFGSEAAIRALSLGAVDSIPKPTAMASPKDCRTIARRVFAAASSTVQPPSRKHPGNTSGMAGTHIDDEMPVILIGASTGGVAALEAILSRLDIDGPPVVIVQHMPGHFLVSFSRLLNRKLVRDVGLANDGMQLTRGDIRLAPVLGQHTEILRRSGSWEIKLRDDVEKTLHCPSVDVLFSSAVKHGSNVIAALLTGLGRDGADGIRLLRQAGAHTIGQDQATCVIYGMPRVAKELGGICRELPLDQIGEALNAASVAHADKNQSRV